VLLDSFRNDRTPDPMNLAVCSFSFSVPGRRRFAACPRVSIRQCKRISSLPVGKPHWVYWRCLWSAVRLYVRSVLFRALYIRSVRSWRYRVFGILDTRMPLELEYDDGYPPVRRCLAGSRSNTMFCGHWDLLELPSSGRGSSTRMSRTRVVSRQRDSELSNAIDDYRKQSR
jgi:hypothetical protein